MFGQLWAAPNEEPLGALAGACAGAVWVDFGVLEVVVEVDAALAIAAPPAASEPVSARVARPVASLCRN